MTKRRTIEIIIETEELLVVKQPSRAIWLKCSKCGGPVEPFAPTADEAGAAAADDSIRDTQFRANEQNQE
jgi:hypothetical protein